MIYEFMATQSFNGYGKPWAGGANINKWDPESSVPGYIIATDGTIGSQNPVNKEVTSDFIECDFADISKVVVGFADYLTTEGTWSAIGLYAADDTFVQRPTQPVFSGVTAAFYTYTKSEATVFGKVRGSCRTYGHDPNCVFLGFDCDEEFSPYANVCMPEGFNIWDPIEQEFTQVYAGFVNSNTRELYLRPWYTEYAGEELVGPWMSSMDEYSEDATPTEGAFVIDFGGELTSLEITPFMLQTLLESLGIRQHFTNGAGLLNSLMDQAQGRVRSEEELLHLSRPLNVIAIGDQLPAGITIKPISKDVLPGLPGKFIR